MPRHKRLSDTEKRAKKKRSKISLKLSCEQTDDNESANKPGPSRIKHRSPSLKAVQQKKYYVTHRTQILTKNIHTMHEKYKSNPEFQQHWKQKMRNKYTGDKTFQNLWRNKMRSKYFTDTHYRNEWRKKMRTKYSEDTHFQNEWRQKMQKKMHTKYTEDTHFRNEWRKKMRTKYTEDTHFRNEWRQKMQKKRHTKYTEDTHFRNEWRKKMRTKYTEDTHFRNDWRKKMRTKYTEDQIFRNHWRNKVHARYIQDARFRLQQRNKMKSQMDQTRQRIATALKTNVRAAIDLFRRHIQEGPVCACVSCHRHMYRQSVSLFTESKYTKIANDVIINMIFLFNQPRSKENNYVCKTCHWYLIRGKIPPQSALNGLDLDTVPSELCLSELESLLVAQRILFMRLLALPRGQQSALHGAVVNVPSNVPSVVTSLPLTPNQAGLIPLKLKRKMEYKGYVLNQFIRPPAIIRAVQWLTHNNPLYHDMPINLDWDHLCANEDPHTWNRLTDSQNSEIEEVTTTRNYNTDNDSSDFDTDNEVLEQKVTGLKYNTCLQPSDPQYAATEMSLAPAESNTPLDFMLDVNAEVLAFPTKFPLGRGGFTGDHHIKLTPKKYFIQRITNKDKRFASDANYIFYAQYVTEMKQIRDNISIALRQKAGRLSAGDVSDVAQLRDMIQRDNAYQFLQNVRGSPPYFQRAVKQLIAMVAQIGCPHFFLTLSAADMRWPELFQIISEQNGKKMTADDIAAMGYEQKAAMLRNDPVLAARHFDHRLKAFFTDILKKASILGEIQTFFYRIEFQLRGSPHAHCLLWTKDGPNMSEASDEEIITYFEDKISAQLQQENEELHDLVGQLQRHSHSVACKKKRTLAGSISQDRRLIARCSLHHQRQKMRTRKRTSSSGKQTYFSVFRRQ